MLYMRNMVHYNIPQRKIITNSVYPTVSRIGNFIKDGYTGPDSSTAIDNSKLQSIKKSFSEMLERRALFMGGIPDSKGKAIAVNMIAKKVEPIDIYNSSYSVDELFPIDTTGCATHFDSEKAIYNALKELIEKNALFLLWYSFSGKELVISDSQFIHENKILHGLEQAGKKVVFYLNDYFNPLKVVVTLIIKESYICSSGIGTSFSISDALHKSIEESYLLLWKNEMNEIVESNGKPFHKEYIDHSDLIAHLKLINRTLEISPASEYTGNGERKIDDLIDSLPKWIEKLYLVPLKQDIRRGLKCVKIFSPDMYNHIPLKEYINLNNLMNTKTFNITKQEMEVLPDCIII